MQTAGHAPLGSVPASDSLPLNVSLSSERRSCRVDLGSIRGPPESPSVPEQWLGSGEELPAGEILPTPRRGCQLRRLDATFSFSRSVLRSIPRTSAARVLLPPTVERTLAMCSASTCARVWSVLAVLGIE